MENNKYSLVGVTDDLEEVQAVENIADYIDLLPFESAHIY